MTSAAAVDQLVPATISGAGLPSWLEERKLADQRTYGDLPWPDSSTMEDWRRTDISHLDPRAFALEDPGAAGPQAGRSHNWERGGEGGALVQQRDGRAEPANLPAELAAQGVLVSSLEDAARDHPDLVRRHLEAEVVPAAAGKLAALNAAFWRGGSFVYVPPGVEAALPVWAAFTTPAAGAAMVLPRSLVVVDEGASLVYTDEYSSPVAAGALSSAVTEVVLGDGARIQYLVLQQWGDDVNHFATHRIHVGRDCQADLVVAATGARLSKVYMEVAMMGPGSNARISGLVIGDRDQHFDYQSLQDHLAPNCVSDLLVKGALRDSARSVYSGLIKIRKEAQHSDAYQANRNLMLSPLAKADSIPKLEIEANDVRCTHGATVGQVDPEQLFYLQSRGFSLREAQNTLVHGFFEPVIDRIPLEQVRQQIHEAIDAELAGLEPAAGAA
ncbi:MAG: Fe-S cluster assembly protein SufD [Chloroflexota bacterium]|jgi:Fe-S cluster assembly protein SufD|nr:Fe-S cluster assembly protein SufD [Chloroflexota bacterium]